ncbi:hypothetical protein BDF19DRAFT_420733 [Syncephalis fuscata]|nr:hypothetical protein BDF19DRAFT_420733 [Syncephalis fuscata]
MSDTDTTGLGVDASIANDSLLSDSIWSDTDEDSIAKYSDDDDDSDWEAEWEENIRELKFLVTGIAIPFIGRWFGRRFAFWGKLLSTDAYLLWTNYWEAWLGVGRRWLLAATTTSL